MGHGVWRDIILTIELELLSITFLLPSGAVCVNMQIMSNNNVVAQPFQLKRVGGSLDIRLSGEFVRTNRLRPGDYVILSGLKILKAEDFALLGRDPTTEAVE
jgi:hypothetical protein